MNDVYCPLSMIGGKPAICLKYYDGNTCQLCPMDSLDAIPRKLHDLVTVLNPVEFEGSLAIDQDLIEAVADVADALKHGQHEIADILSYPAALFGTAQVASAIGNVADAIANQE